MGRVPHWESDSVFPCFSSSQQFTCVSGTTSSQPQVRGDISSTLTLHSLPHLLKTKPWQRLHQVRAGGQGGRGLASAAQSSGPQVPSCERVVWGTGFCRQMGLAEAGEGRGMCWRLRANGQVQKAPPTTWG